LNYDIQTLVADDGLDLEALSALLDRAYGGNIATKDVDAARWLFCENPQGKARFNVAIERQSGKYVSCAGLVPMNYQFGPDACAAASIVNTAVDPDFKVPGVFKDVFRACLETGEQGGFRHLMGFANAMAYPVYHRMGIDKVGNFITHYKFASLKRPSLEIRPANLAEIAVLPVDGKFIQRNISPAHLEWRFGTKFLGQYRSVICKGDQGDFGVVYKVSKRAKLKSVDIQHMRLGNWTSKKITALAASLSWYEKAVLVTYCCNAPSQPSQILQGSGFRTRTRDIANTGIIAIDFPPYGTPQEKFRSWWRLNDAGDTDW